MIRVLSARLPNFIFLADPRRHHIGADIARSPEGEALPAALGEEGARDDQRVADPGVASSRASVSQYVQGSQSWGATASAAAWVWSVVR